MNMTWQVRYEDEDFVIAHDEIGDYNLLRKLSGIIVGVASHHEEGDIAAQEDEIGMWVAHVWTYRVYVGPDEQMAVELLWEHRHKSKF
jgi:hypothetical protein